MRLFTFLALAAFLFAAFGVFVQAQEPEAAAPEKRPASLPSPVKKTSPPAASPAKKAGQRKASQKKTAQKKTGQKKASPVLKAGKKNAAAAQKGKPAKKAAPAKIRRR